MEASTHSFDFNGIVKIKIAYQPSLSTCKEEHRMITDDPQDMKRRLTEYVNSASLALETLATLDPADFDLSKRPEPGSEYERYLQALNDLNTARTWLGIATEQLHDLLNQYNDTLIEVTQEQRKEEAQ